MLAASSLQHPVTPDDVWTGWYPRAKPSTHTSHSTNIHVHAGLLRALGNGLAGTEEKEQSVLAEVDKEDNFQRENTYCYQSINPRKKQQPTVFSPNSET